ncbi:YetF domain-containing protein [Gracilibacillus sp. YIM 98692]|uniref:DUF421 domain-containing protein n=1 Tax=Gracilibacillus sp. YIM 98692 TaxID=2663532 RepID=UPI0013D02179|nr:YetF domain-containing protein [Gracilibacillus sp. YIM 98692]
MPGWIQAIIYFSAALILLRFGGKRTISQATPSEVVIMIGIGTVLVHPLKSEDPWISVYHGMLIVLGVILVSVLQIYIPKVQKWVMGEPLLVVQNGEVLHKNLKKARITEDELKMKLRVKKINDITKLKSVTLEVSGEIGLELLDQPATQKDIDDIKRAIEMIGQKVGAPVTFNSRSSDLNQNLFNQVEEVQEKDPLQ